MVGAWGGEVSGRDALSVKLGLMAKEGFVVRWRSISEVCRASGRALVVERR